MTSKSQTNSNLLLSTTATAAAPTSILQSPSTTSSRISQLSTNSTLSPYHPNSLPPEHLIIVRPPPSKANNSLNLQIQLLAPSPAATNQRRASVEYSRGVSEITIGGASFQAVAQASVGGAGGSSGNGNSSAGGGVPLRRASSVRSNRSGSSSVGSTTTGTTGSSLGGGGASGRRVTPLYNLDFHSVLTTTVTDAGTDEKIAKFLKKGVEILNFAILDPIELSNSSPMTATPSRPSTSSNRPSIPIPPSSTSSPSFLNKLKRMSLGGAPKPPVSLPPPTSNPDQPQVVSLFRTNSSDSSANRSRPIPFNSTSNSSSGSNGNPRGYTWTIRKWLRKDLENSRIGLKTLESVKFEWKRGSKPVQKNKPLSSTSMSRSTSSGAGDESFGGRTLIQPIRRDSSLEAPFLLGEEQTLDPNKLVPVKNVRSRPGSIQSAGTGGNSFEERSKSPGGWSNSSSSLPSSDDPHPSTGDTFPPRPPPEEDSGDESDPEDSERSWTCELIITSKTNPPRRLLLCTLTPAPHHPKLVAHLAIPFNLSPIALGEFEPGKGMSNSGLSVEEMKDVVNVTCLWLVLRESLGGLGKRKGK